MFQSAAGRSSSKQYLLDVDFQGPGATALFAVGGGETIEDAIAAARDALALDHEWEVVRWNDVHGE
jgi:hypothetical protein